MQSCLYHMVSAFMGQSMAQVRRDLRAWYLLPVNTARLCDMLQTHLQSPAEWSQRSRLAPNPSNLGNECYVYSLALLFNVSFQILSSTASVRSSTYWVHGVWPLGMSINILLGLNCYGIQVISRGDTQHNGGACVATECDTEQKTRSQCTTWFRSFVRHLAWWSASRIGTWSWSPPLLL